MFQLYLQHFCCTLHLLLIKVFNITIRNFFSFWKLKYSQAIYYNTFVISRAVLQYSHPWEALFLLSVNQENLSSLDSNSAAFSHSYEFSSFFLPSCKIPLLINLFKHINMPHHIWPYLHYSKASCDLVLVCSLKDKSRPLYR